MKTCLYWLALLFLSATICHAQRVVNVRAESKGNVVIITYDLVGTIRGQLYEVTLYSSHNDKAQPLVYVRGDIGTNQTPGRNKTIEWGAKKELKEFEGEVSFEVRAKLLASPIRFMNPTANYRYKRNREYKVDWLGALADEEMQLELFQDSVKLMNVSRVPNKGTYQWAVPKELKPGDNYRLKVSSTQKAGNYAFSGRFSIRRQIPLVIKVIPAGLLSIAATYFIINRAGTVNPLEEDLPLPPGPE
jgi:hypothetical protein